MLDELRTTVSHVVQNEHGHNDKYITEEGHETEEEAADDHLAHNVVVISQTKSKSESEEVSTNHASEKGVQLLALRDHAVGCAVLQCVAHAQIVKCENEASWQEHEEVSMPVKFNSSVDVARAAQILVVTYINQHENNPDQRHDNKYETLNHNEDTLEPVGLLRAKYEGLFYLEEFSHTIIQLNGKDTHCQHQNVADIHCKEEIKVHHSYFSFEEVVRVLIESVSSLLPFFS